MPTRSVATGFLILAALSAAWAARLDRERRQGPPPGAPRRIVCTSPALVHCLFAIGAGDRVVGVSRYCRFPAEARTLPQIGGIVDPSLAAIQALAPDRLFIQETSPQVESFAVARGIPVEHFTIETIADVLAAMKRLGKLCECEENAAREVARLESALRAYREEAPRERPRVLIAFDHVPGELREIYCPGKEGFLVECLEAAGGETAFPDFKTGYRPIAREAIVERRPDAIVDLRWDETPPEVADVLRADWRRALPDLPAVREGRILLVVDEESLIPGPSLDRLVGKMAHALREATGARK